MLSFFAERRAKALSASPTVLEAMADRTFSAYPLIATPPAQRRIDAVYVEAQNASYGWMYRQQPAVRALIDYIAANVAQLGVKVFERVSDDKREHRGDHPGAVLLRRPNPQTPGQQFIYELLIDYLIYDNAYALKFRGDNGQMMAVRLEPPMTALVGRSHFTVDAYRIYQQDGSSFDVPPGDMIHWRGYNPTDPRKGESKLETLREELAADLAARKAVTELHRSGLALPGWLTRPADAPEWTKTARDRFQEDAAAMAQAGKRRIPVWEDGMEYHQGGVAPEDAEYLASRQFAASTVAAQYGLRGVPPSTDDERKQFYSDVIPPLTERIAAFLDLQILQQEFDADDHYFEFGREKLMDELYKTLTSASGRPVLTTNEARAKIDQPPIEGGDELVTPANVIVGDNPKPSTGIMPIQDPNGPDQGGGFRSGEADEPAPAGRRASMNGNGKALLLPRRVTKDRSRQEFADDLTSVLRGFHDLVQRSAKSRQMDIKAAADETRWEKTLGERMLKPTRRGVALIGGIEAARIGLDEFDLDQVEHYLESATRGKASEVVEALRKALRDGDPQEVLAQAKEVDAPRAAMTFATAMSAFAVKEAVAQAPDRDTRTVTVYGGECDVCAPHQGALPLAEMSEWPPYHPHCGCLAEVDGGGPPAQKAVPVETKAQQPVFNITLPTVNITMPGIEVPEGAVQMAAPETHFHEGAFKSETQVEAPHVNVAPAEVTFEKGAMSAPQVTVEAAPAPNIQVESPTVNVEPSPVNVTTPDVRVDVAAPEINVEAPEQPNLNVTVEQPARTTKRVIRDENGHIKEIIEEGRKQTVTRNPETNRIESIEEE